jgi:lactoylglutathione lyase
MKIDHIALWTSDLERSLSFYTEFFGAEHGEKYINPVKQLETYFLQFDGGARLELMRKPLLVSISNDNASCGWVHVAFEVSSIDEVDRKAQDLKSAAYLIEEPRWTGDGYYEAVALDPDGNRIEILSRDEPPPIWRTREQKVK